MSLNLRFYFAFGLLRRRIGWPNCTEILNLYALLLNMMFGCRWNWRNKRKTENIVEEDTRGESEGLFEEAIIIILVCSREMCWDFQLYNFSATDQSLYVDKWFSWHQDVETINRDDSKQSFAYGTAPNVFGKVEGMFLFGSEYHRKQSHR